MVPLLGGGRGLRSRPRPLHSLEGASEGDDAAASPSMEMTNAVQILAMSWCLGVLLLVGGGRGWDVHVEVRRATETDDFVSVESRRG